MLLQFRDSVRYICRQSRGRNETGYIVMPDINIDEKRDGESCLKHAPYGDWIGKCQYLSSTDAKNL